MRFLLMEVGLFWLNGARAEQLAQLLGLGYRQRAQEILAAYRKATSARVVYNASDRRQHFADDAESLCFAPDTPEELLLWLAGQHADLSRTDPDHPLAGMVLDAQSYAPRILEPERMRLIFGAIFHRQLIRIDYLAKTRQQSILVSPHRILRGGQRYHLRGHAVFSNGDKHCVDLVLGRILEAETLGSDGYLGPEFDHEWHRVGRLFIELVPELPPQAARALLAEMGLGPGHASPLMIKGPYPVMRYLLKDYETRRIEGYLGPVWRGRIEAVSWEPEHHSSFSQ